VYRSRIMFTCHYGRSGSFRCFPPHLAVTQLLQVLVSTTAANGQGISPRKRTLLCSALAWASCPWLVKRDARSTLLT
ncbi:MAG: hypothetical protein L3J39_19390, partial [Verrucomicrobiales bacterium]|nr:hypothetical protein [Verrucomicrobiales bacterium]